MKHAFTKQIRSLFTTPDEFFENARNENWKTAFRFFLLVTLIISFVTPIVNYLGVESTDFSSAYQAQIIAYRLLKTFLFPQFGNYAYFIEFFLIIVFACAILILGTLFLHLLYRLIGGKGSVSNAWKSMCYGVAPTVLGGFLPYIALFTAFYSMLLQFYLGPKILYKVKESRAIFLLALIIAISFIEMFVAGTTVELLLPQ
jgi:hypothetical protein